MLVMPDELEPTSLSPIELRLGHQTLKALMVRVDDGLSPFEIATPLLQRSYQGEQLLFVHWVTNFSWGELLGVEGDRLESSSLILE
jgi:hypothetical protein